MDTALVASDPQATPQTGRGTGAAGGVMLRLSMDVPINAAITPRLCRQGIDMVTAQADGSTHA
jgi:hypothetical protein